MENDKNVKRSIRIPKSEHAILGEIAKERGISVNKLILEIIDRHLREG